MSSDLDQHHGRKIGPFPALEDYRHLLQRPRIAPRDTASVEEIMAIIREFEHWKQRNAKQRSSNLRGARRVLDWLATFPGEGWQARWLAADADRDLSFLDTLTPARMTPRPWVRHETVAGMAQLMLARAVLPSLNFLTAYWPRGLFDRVQQVMRPDLFARLHAEADRRQIPGQNRGDAMAAICKLLLHTGKDLDRLQPEDVFAMYAWAQPTPSTPQRIRGLALAWELLSVLGVTEPGSTLRHSLLRGQRPTADLVDDYGPQCREIRDVFVRYLEERRPALDYNSLRGLVINLVGVFWCDLERHHPGIDSLHLSEEVAAAWRERLSTVTDPDGTVRPRRELTAIFTSVRAFYFDLQQWAMTDPSWAQWAVPSPVRRVHTRGVDKLYRQRRAEVHQRIRERLPTLPALLETARTNRDTSAALLTAASAAEPGSEFAHAGARYRRTAWASEGRTNRNRPTQRVHVTNLDTGQPISVTTCEDRDFWAWALIETLRHTGIRVEELLELTQLALVSYQLSDTGEVVPLLQIAPSKTDQERLLLISPELASVLATVISRLRRISPDGAVPLVARWDEHERVIGAPLPHLFQRTRGGRPHVITSSMVNRLVNEVVTLAGLRDAAGAPLRFTPHDFRRLFITDAVAGGLPIHIAARIVGHASIDTTQAYLAVFPDELIRAYQTFLRDRRDLRPSLEYREPTSEEWREFEQHFQTRKLELGTCGRPYGAPCKHEHACIRCPMLRVDPAQRRRLAEIAANLTDRIAEAREHGWLGEVEGLTASLVAARAKLAALDKSTKSRPPGTAALGMPVLRGPRPDEPGPSRAPADH